MEKFDDLRSGGRALAERLGGLRAGDLTVLGIVRGGIPAAIEVADALGAPLDVVLRRGLLVPYGPARPVGVAAVAGTVVTDPEVVERAAGDGPFASLLQDAIAALTTNSTICRGASPPLDLAGRTVLIVDNGMRSGGTMASACRAVRRLDPRRVVAAVPTADPDSRAVVEPLADELVSLAWPSRFGHVGLWYRRYDVPAIEGIRALLDARPGAPR